jgi:hypothetical protein
MNAILCYCDFPNLVERDEYARLIHKREIAIFSAIGLDPYGVTNLWDFISEFTGIAYPGIFTSRSSFSSSSSNNDTVQMPATTSDQDSSINKPIQSRSASVPAYYYERLKIVLCICERSLLEYDVMMTYAPSTIVLAAIAIADAVSPADDTDNANGGKAPSPCSITDPFILQSDLQSDCESQGSRQGPPLSSSSHKVKPHYAGMNKVLLQHIGFTSEHDLVKAGVLSCIQHLQMKFRQESFLYAMIYAKRIFHTLQTNASSTSKQEENVHSIGGNGHPSQCSERFDYLQWLRILQDELSQATASSSSTSEVKNDIAVLAHDFKTIARTPIQQALDITSASLSSYRAYLSLLPAVFESMAIHQKLVPSVATVTPMPSYSSAMTARTSPLPFEEYYQHSECTPAANHTQQHQWCYPRSSSSLSSSSVSAATTWSACSAATTTLSSAMSSVCWPSSCGTQTDIHNHNKSSHDMTSFSPVGINTSHSSMGFFSPARSVGTGSLPGPPSLPSYQYEHKYRHPQQSPWSASMVSSATTQPSPYTSLFSPTRPQIRYANYDIKERRWQELISALNQKIQQVDLEEDEPLKGARLRYRSVYHKLILCPPLT